jgi:signal transduction histidine kinase
VSFIEQFLNIISSEPWGLVYHAVLAFSILWTLQASLSLLRNTEFPQSRRMVFGLSLMLGLRLILYIANGLAWQALLPYTFLPTLDCFINLFSLIFILWLWAFPEPSRLADAGAVLLFLLTITLTALGIIWWSAIGVQVAFYDSILGFGSDIYVLALMGLGLLALLVRRPNGWGFGFWMIALFSLGHLLNLLFPISGSDFSSAVRLTQMVAYPLLTMLPQRYQTAGGAVSGSSISRNLTQVRYRTDARLLKLVVDIGKEASSDKAYQEITRLIAQLMQADVSLLVSLPVGLEYLNVYCGYNMHKGEAINGFTLALRMIPLLNNALRKGKPLRLPASSTSSDILSLGQALGVERCGPLLAMSTVRSEDGSILGVVLLSPYTNRGWSLEDQSYLVNSTDWLAQILQQVLQSQQGKPVVETAQELIQANQAQLERLVREKEDLQTQLEMEKQRLLQEQERAESLAALVEAQESIPDAMASLDVEAIPPDAELVSIGAASPEEPDSLHVRPHEQEQLESATYAAISDDHTTSEEQAEVIASMAQDLRQPMSSIVGYTDLLLGESVGILGALQRKFLERVRASTERMGSLVDDIIQMATMEKDNVKLKSEPVDLNVVIDEAIALTISQIREKNIVLRVDIPEQLPHMTADRDAMQQIVLHLLQNAESATPSEGEIALSAKVHTGTDDVPDQQDYLLLRVSDMGGGIPAEDLSRVFTRLYRADNALIQGVGDTGVGLSIVRTLVEAQGGRVWVDSEMGRGSTFSVLLPFAQDNNGDGSQEGTSA